MRDRVTEVTEWRHGVEPAGHLVIPIPRAESYEHDLRPVCDFCMTTSDRESSWLYPTEQFHIEDDDGNVVNIDDGEGWGACARCHRLIEAGNWDALAARAATLMADRHPDRSYEMCSEVVTVAHSTFQRVRVGDPIPATEYEGPSLT